MICNEFLCFSFFLSFFLLTVKTFYIGRTLVCSTITNKWGKWQIKLIVEKVKVFKVFTKIVLKFVKKCFEFENYFPSFVCRRKTKFFLTFKKKKFRIFFFGFSKDSLTRTILTRKKYFRKIFVLKINSSHLRLWIPIERKKNYFSNLNFERQKVEF